VKSGKTGADLDWFFIWGSSRLSKYLSTLSKPQSSFTTGMMAGTSRSKWEGEGCPEAEQWGSFLAALIASLVAQCTEAARSKGGSPDAATKDASQ
jgi:hypothetical protein